MQVRVSLKETVYGLSLMPPSAVHIKPDRIVPEPSIEMTQSFHETFPISPLRTDNPEAPQKWSHPTRKIKPLLVLAGCGDAIRISALGPPPSQSRMQGKSCLILKDHRLPRPQILEFFLTSGEIAWLLPPGLEDRHSWPALTDIPVGASKPGLAALSVSGRTGALDARPGSDHPNAPGSGQNLGAIFLNAVPLPERSGASAGTGVRGSVCSLGRSIRLHLRPGSIDSGSSASVPKPVLSSRVAAPRRSEEWRRFSTPSKPPGGPWPRPLGFPGSPPDDEYQLVPYQKHNIKQTNA